MPDLTDLTNDREVEVLKEEEGKMFWLVRECRGLPDQVM